MYYNRVSWENGIRINRYFGVAIPPIDVFKETKINLMEVTIGNLIDQLSIENIRIWFAENIKRKEGASDNEIANATKVTNSANMKRNALIQAIDEALGQQSFKQGDNKMYGK